MFNSLGSFSVILIVLVALYGAITLRCVYYKHETTELRNQIKTQNTAILQYKYQSDQFEKASETAQKQAKKMIKISNKRVEQILKEKVSTSCEESIKWGIEQARIFNEKQ